MEPYEDIFSESTVLLPRALNSSGVMISEGRLISWF